MFIRSGVLTAALLSAAEGRVCVCDHHPLQSHDVNHSSKANHGEHMTLLFHRVLSNLCDLFLCVSLERSSSVGSKPQLCGVVATVD